VKSYKKNIYLLDLHKDLKRKEEEIIVGFGPNPLIICCSCFLTTHHPLYIYNHTTNLYFYSSTCDPHKAFREKKETKNKTKKEL